MSQTKQILDYMLAGNNISPIQALNMFGSFRLGARCYDIKKLGYPLESKMVVKGKKKWKEYWIKK